jgi:hypothetical protein
MTEPYEFPPCISCKSSFHVDEDHVDDVWFCKRCLIQWSKND